MMKTALRLPAVSLMAVCLASFASGSPALAQAPQPTAVWPKTLEISTEHHMFDGVNHVAFARLSFTLSLSVDDTGSYPAVVVTPSQPNWVWFKSMKVDDYQTAYPDFAVTQYKTQAIAEEELRYYHKNFVTNFSEDLWEQRAVNFMPDTYKFYVDFNDAGTWPKQRQCSLRLYVGPKAVQTGDALREPRTQRC